MKKKSQMITIFFILLTALLGTALPVSADTDNTVIQVDQVGYLPEYSKVAIVAAAGTGTDSFKVVETGANTVVYTGSLSAPYHDPASGNIVRQADFSQLNVPGTYQVVVDGLGSSYPFKIDDNIYYVPLIQSLRSYTLGRSNIAIDDPLTGFKRAASHEQDKTAKVFFSDNVSTKGQVLDVSGGWYDAGDYGKYIPTAGVTVANLLMAYEAQPEKFTKGQMFFPEGTSSSATMMPDVLVELKYELDWMMKMQRPDGSVFLKVGGDHWPSVGPQDDKQARYIYGVSTYGTAIYGATLAMAARSYEKYDPQYAAQLLDLSKKAFAFLEQNPEPDFRLDAGQNDGSGPYDKKTDKEDRIWAAAELFKTTGDKHYEEYLKKNFAGELTSKPDIFGWLNTFALGQWAYITSKGSDDSLKSKAKDAFLGYADEIVQQIAQDGYHCSLKVSEYSWGSTRNALAKANILLMANQVNPQAGYINGALDQIHYLFGRNANAISYMSGAGTNPVQHPLANQIRVNPDVYLPGLVVGGPNNWAGGDPLQAKLIADGKISPARAHIDKSSSYSTNEYAIDYVAPATYALSFFSRPAPQITADDIRLKLQKVSAQTNLEQLKTNQSGNKAKGKGKADKDYIKFFDGISPYADAKSSIKQIVSNKKLKVTYKLANNGWLGACTDQFMEDWSDFTGIKFMLTGGTGNKVRIQLIDGNGVHYEKVIVDDAVQGKPVTIPFSEFKVWTDWQPDGVDTSKPFSLNPVMSLIVCPLEGQGTLVLSDMYLYK